MNKIYAHGSATAEISECGAYRYTLTRHWGDGYIQPFVMLNPSTADAFQDDRTIGRCIEFSKREGAGGLLVVNLFALRATNPKELDGHPDPIGIGNNSALNTVMSLSRRTTRPVICGWGAKPIAQKQGRLFIARAQERCIPLVCLEKTKGGAPKHPLYIAGDKPLLKFGETPRP